MTILRVLLLILLSLSAVNLSVGYIPDFGFAEVFEGLIEDDLTTFGVFEAISQLYMSRIGQLIFWGVLFSVVYIALHVTTGGAFIPAVAFSAVGFIVINVLPLELMPGVKLIITVGLFVVPIYEYIMK
ncbi:MAG: hypothetical protein FWE54_01715 [Methanimicrococcus sp.]|nr:hypothetical protein [Methanimicrococcus sp.]